MKVVTLRVELKVIRALKEAAEKEGRSLSSMMRRVLAREVDNIVRGTDGDQETRGKDNE